MAKKSAIEKNNRRMRMAKQFAGKRAKLKAASVDPNLGDLHVNDPTGRGADILVIQGTWVYDSAHEGWNEIHPIKHCQKIGTWERTWNESPVPDGNPKRWCEAIGAASDPLTVAAQDEPQNQWVIHPVIDGCDSGDDDDPPPVIK